MEPQQLKDVAAAKIDESRELLLSVSSRLWQNPELALEERMAHQLLTETLESSGFSVTRHFVLDTGFKAEFGSARPHIAVMCEFDALPGIGHACGHNLIAEVAVGAGLGIKAAMEAGGLSGRVTVLGTPAEEAHGGKIDMIRSAFFTDVDVAMMAHPYKLTVARPRALSIQAFDVTFTGKASHAAGSPWEGLNALDAAVTAYQSVSNLRQEMRPDWRVHGIVKEGGQRPNIIPERAVLEYYIRAPTDKELAVLRRKVDACFDAAALATGCSWQSEINGHANSNLITNESLIKFYTKNLVRLNEPFLESEPDAVIGSTDMGNVSYEVPSVHPMFSVGGQAAIHTRDFAELAGDPAAQPHALTQAKALAMTGIDILTQPGVLEQIWEGFRADMARLKDF
uniref:Peptidase M20 domain-containing protein 2 n=1 Tax=Macrostomum lignano TaxID=282301 RepID=A0A1I8H920_9PLAT